MSSLDLSPEVPTVRGGSLLRDKLGVDPETARGKQDGAEGEVNSKTVVTRPHLTLQVLWSWDGPSVLSPEDAREGTSLVIQWLRLHAPSVGGPGSILGQGTRSHVLQLKSSHAATKDPANCNEDARRKILRTSTMTRHSQRSQQSFNNNNKNALSTQQSGGRTVGA